MAWVKNKRRVREGLGKEGLERMLV